MLKFCKTALEAKDSNVM